MSSYHTIFESTNWSWWSCEIGRTDYQTDTFASPGSASQIPPLPKVYCTVTAREVFRICSCDLAFRCCDLFLSTCHSHSNAMNKRTKPSSINFRPSELSDKVMTKALKQPGSLSSIKSSLEYGISHLQSMF